MNISESKALGIISILASCISNFDKILSFRSDDIAIILEAEETAFFIYYLLWWIMIINLLVGLFNMLPWGMLDGGRFLELGLGKFVKEKKSTKIVKITGKCIYGMLILMTLIWLFRIIT